MLPQDLAQVNEENLPVYNRCALYALGAAYLNLISQLTTVPAFCQHIHEVGVCARDPESSGSPQLGVSSELFLNCMSPVLSLGIEERGEVRSGNSEKLLEAAFPPVWRDIPGWAGHRRHPGPLPHLLPAPLHRLPFYAIPPPFLEVYTHTHTPQVRSHGTKAMSRSFCYESFQIAQKQRE